MLAVEILVAYIPLLMQFVFLAAAILLYIKTRIPAAALFAVGIVLMSPFFSFQMAARLGPTAQVSMMYVKALGSILQAGGLLWFALSVPKRSGN